MLQYVWNWRKHLEHDVSTYFQGVPQAEVIEKKESLNELSVNVEGFYESMKMHEVRKVAKRLEIPFTASTKKEELIQLINKANG